MKRSEKEDVEDVEEGRFTYLMKKKFSTVSEKYDSHFCLA